jgi:hypothetical protein
MRQEDKTVSVDASPTKRFFVEMFTRDIELEDAILDLLDNSLDGAVRSNQGKKPNLAHPFDGYWANITLDRDCFIIEDNCGGMTKKAAVERAFRMGRDNTVQKSKLQTIGTYGIGMKRAMFKLGEEISLSNSHKEDGQFEVSINAEWLAGDEWKLALRERRNRLQAPGVRIEIRALRGNIADLFDVKTGGFSEKLESRVKKHYSFIIQKGFQVKINGRGVKPEDNTTYVPKNWRSKSTVAPYAFKLENDGVNVTLIMGMYERFPTESEREEAEQGRRSSEKAGWTIVCNDRVVVSHDKTHITGWGEAGTPEYHTQYNMLAGLVEFTSTDASKLPLTTTKRGIDLNSALYATVKDQMRDALKHFTSFTNRWKTDTPERSSMHKLSAPLEIRAAAANIPRVKWTEVRKGLGGKKFVPELPAPESNKTHSRITFERELDDIREVAEFLGVEEGAKPSTVGASAFDSVLTRARR